VIASLHDLETEQRNVKHVHQLAEKSWLFLESYIKVRDEYNFIQKKKMYVGFFLV